MSIPNTQSSQLIRDFRDLCEYLGASRRNNASLDRALYKTTACGAWGEALVRREILSEAQEWEIAATHQENGRILVQARKKGDEVWLDTIKDLPLNVVGAFALDMDEECEPVDPSSQALLSGSIAESMWQVLSESAEKARLGAPESETLIECSGMLFPHRWTLNLYLVSSESNRILFRATGDFLSNGKRIRYFKVGSIVEGVDAEVMPEQVKLPCTTDDIDHAIEQVEREADGIWMETHGCETCIKHWEDQGSEDEDIYHVWEDCPDCHGEGTII